MQSAKNYQYLISQLPKLSDEQFKRDYLNHLKWTESIASILPLIDDLEALRLVRLAFDVDLMLGAFLAGRVKPELQEETVGWIYKLDISDELKLKLLAKTKSRFAVSFLEDFIKNIPDAADSFYLYENLVSQTIKNLEIVDAGLYKRMLRNLLEDERQWIRRMAIAVFGEHINKSEITILTKLLKDEDMHIRYKAILALGKIADDSVLENIVEALDDEFPPVRGIAVAILGRIGGKSILDKIIYFLDDEERSVRIQTIKALRIIGGNLAEELIIHTFLDKEDSVSKNVFETLLKIDRDKAINFIFITSQSNDVEVRRKAALFLGGIVKRADRVSYLPLLVNLLNDENPEVRKTAAKELTVPKIGMESPEFEALRDEYQELRWQAEIDIEEIINESDLTTLLLKSHDCNYYVRSAANKAIDIKIAKAENTEDIKEDFLTALQHENPDIRGTAASYLGTIGGKSVIPILLEVLQDKNTEVRLIAASVLAGMGNKSVIPIFIEALEDISYQIRETAVYKLALLADNSTIPTLVKTLQDENHRVRAAAAYALSLIPDNSTLTALTKVLQDNDFHVRQMAILALDKNGSEQAIKAILTSLPHNDYLVDKVAAEILMKVGKLEHIPYLWKALLAARYINFTSATNNLYSAIENIQQQHQLYNPEFC
ncbi:MAG: HEAT repeat domain-containing protein [Rivularia sp. (in: Bacteria)]|nr:HEAT repeat domain-containing protein [Rivularia sp. MS3]